MSTVTAGNPVTLDALFAQDGQPSPSAVTFEVLLPDTTVVSFAPPDSQVTNPSVDYWECALGVLAEQGEYRWSATGLLGSEVTETLYGTVFVVPSAVSPAPIVPPGPMLGPCFTWITGEDVAACERLDYNSEAASVFDTVAYEASMALYEISGRRFPGVCSRWVRPTRNDCGCWGGGPVSYGMGPWYWTAAPWGMAGGWAWWNEQGDRLGCAPMSRVRLAGYPVRQILNVVLDGNVVPEYDGDGNPNWRLDGWRYLTRMDQPAAGGAPSQPRFWPSCQVMSLDDDQPGTFSIEYQWGEDPPQLGRAAAIEVASQLFLACGGAPCVLPPGTTSIDRQGIHIERGLLANWADPRTATGLVSVDLFLQAYCRGERGGRRSAIFSPDIQRFAQRMGVPGTRPGS